MKNNLKHAQVFKNIYETKKWGDNKDNNYSGSSGSGSSLAYNKDTYIPVVRKFIRDRNIKSVIDIGCGDWQCSHLIYKDIDIIYNGYDIYEKVILNNQQRYRQYNFIHMDIINNVNALECGDLCIIKDVLQHWPVSDIYYFLNYLTTSMKYKYIMITNCRNQGTDDQDIKIGGFRPLTALMYPLKKYKPEIIYRYNNKEVSLITCIEK